MLRPAGDIYMIVVFAVILIRGPQWAKQSLLTAIAAIAAVALLVVALAALT